MITISQILNGYVLRHIAQNLLMGIHMVKSAAMRWHKTGMCRSKDRVLPVMAKFLNMLEAAGRSVKDKIVLELGPGQTPDLLFAALLYGAKKVIALDINKYLKSDLYDLNLYKETREWIRDAVNRGELPLAETFNGERYATELPQIPLSDLYFSVYDGRRFPLEDESVDIIWTKSVLEHVREPTVMIREMKRVLKPGGIMLHIIDLRDHTTLENGKDWLRFLRYSDMLWNLMTGNRSTWANRLRAFQWKNLFEETGFKLIYEDTANQPFHKDFSRKKLAAPFLNFQDYDLSIAWLNVAYIK